MQFKDGQLQNIVESALQHASLPPGALELELSESLLVDETDQIQKQLKSLSELGCNIGQGYYWSKPVPGDVLSELLHNHKRHEEL